MVITCLISGGQSGIDKMALEIGKQLGIKTGGTAPLGWKTENGPDYTLESFNLKQSTSSDYKVRTIQNIQDSDGTVVFGDAHSVGSKLTIRMCITHKKPHLINPSSAELSLWIVKQNINVLNVAGNRASKLSSNKLAEYYEVLFNSLKN